MTFERGLESPDGKTVWDGGAWRPLSEDKEWWWDGTAWKSASALSEEMSVATDDPLAAADAPDQSPIPDETQDALEVVKEQGEMGPGGTGEVRELPNGAVVSASGYYYWAGAGWRPLISAPPVKAPG